MYKKIYCYDALSGEYTNEDIAQKSPLDKEDVYLFPPNCTEIAPPKSGEHLKACYVDGEWKLTPDYRNMTYYSKTDQSRHEITELGVEPDADWTDTAPTDSDAVWNGNKWEVPFVVLVERKKAEIAQARYEAEISGVNNICTDRESQSLITGAALKAMQDNTYTCKWKGIDGFVELTATQIIAVADSVRAHVQSCFDHEAELLPLIEAATTEAELNVVKWGD